jgi:hypothetical protein
MIQKLKLFATLLLSTFVFSHASYAAERPNILLIVTDDLGYRDLGCYGAEKIKTPRIDRLAGEGVRFTDAHSVCAVCQPSRYSLLSGTYFWHARRKPDYSLYFHVGQVTLPSLLKSAGYHTAALGKWHSGFGRGAPDPDWNAELKPGPLEIGFDSFFGTPKTHNEPPLVFVEDRHVVGLDPAFERGAAAWRTPAGWLPKTVFEVTDDQALRVGPEQGGKDFVLLSNSAGLASGAASKHHGIRLRINGNGQPGKLKVTLVRDTNSLDERSYTAECDYTGASSTHDLPWSAFSLATKNTTAPPMPCAFYGLIFSGTREDGSVLHIESIRYFKP